MLMDMGRGGRFTRRGFSGGMGVWVKTGCRVREEEGKGKKRKTLEQMTRVSMEHSDAVPGPIKRRRCKRVERN